jgi:CcmD family protein
MPKNLILAYAVTWVIHLGYISHLVRRSRRLKRDTSAPPSTASLANNR